MFSNIKLAASSPTETNGAAVCQLSIHLIVELAKGRKKIAAASALFDCLGEAGRLVAAAVRSQWLCVLPRFHDNCKAGLC